MLRSACFAPRTARQACLAALSGNSGHAYRSRNFSGAAPEKPDDSMSLSKWMESETKNKRLDALPSFGSYNRRGKYFNEGARRTQFNPTQLLRPVDLKPYNLVHPLDREDRKPRPVIRRPPTKAEARLTDPFLYYKLDISKEPYHPELLSPFLTPLGRIKTRTQTGLSKRSQKKVAAAIRRARCMGFLPYFGKPLERFSEDHQQRRDGKGVDLPSFAR